MFALNHRKTTFPIVNSKGTKLTKIANNILTGCLKLDHANISNINIQFSSLVNRYKNCSNDSAINVNFDLYENWCFYRLQFARQNLLNDFCFVLFLRWIFANWHNDNRDYRKFVASTELSNRQSHTFLINFNSYGAGAECFRTLITESKALTNLLDVLTFILFPRCALQRALFLSLSSDIICMGAHAQSMLQG